MNLEYKYEELTVNLPTLDFNSIVQIENLCHLPLRPRSHCLFVNGCFHSYFYIYILKIYRKACDRIIFKGSNVHLTKFMLDINDVDDTETKVGIIGYGRLGSAICKDLIDSKIVPTSNMVIYTRNPDTSGKLKEKGAIIDRDCSILPQQCTVIFICVLASQIESVAKKLRGHLNLETILYIFTSGMSLSRLKQLFKHDGIVTEQYLWNDSLCSVWNPRFTISEALENSSIITSTCPLPISVTLAKYVNCQPKLFTLWIYSLCNIATTIGLSAQDSVKLLNFVLFEQDSTSLIEINDIVEGLSDTSEKFPVFSLSDITDRDTFMDKKISDDEGFQAELLKNYQNVLSIFCSNKKFNVD